MGDWRPRNTESPRHEGIALFRLFGTVVGQAGIAAGIFALCLGSWSLFLAVRPRPPRYHATYDVPDPKPRIDENAFLDKLREAIKKK